MFSKILRFFPLRVWLILLGLGIFFWFWVFGHQGLLDLEQLRRVRAELIQEEKELLKERAQLKQELKLLKDPRYQKHLIHKELGFVEGSEVILKFKKAETDKSSPAPNKSAATPKARQN